MKQKTLQKHFSSLNKDSSGNPTVKQLLNEMRERISNCGKTRAFRCINNECEEQQLTTIRIVPEYCGYRICPNRGCRSKRDIILQRRIEPKLNNFRDARFITLTLKDYHPLTREVHERLNYAWKRLSLLLRKAGHIKRYIKVTELTQHEYVDKDLNYRVVYFFHLHVVYDGTYIPFKLIQSSWERYTRTSKWVNISRVKKNISASAYLRKYLGKLVYDSIDVEEYFQVKKIKMLSSWNCGEEVETLLELDIIKMKLVCANCGCRLMPELYIPKEP